MRSQTGNILTLHQTAGQFVQDEAITVDGISNGRIITKVTEFGVNDIHSIRQEVGVQTFSGDLYLVDSHSTLLLLQQVSQLYHHRQILGQLVYKQVTLFSTIDLVLLELY